MKIVITENQFEKLKNSEEPKVLHILSFEIFGNDWDKLQKYLDRKGNPLYSIGGDLDLRHTPIESLGNLTSVGGYLYLYGSEIKSLGNLTSVGGYLYLYGSEIQSLGNLTSVGGYLNLRDSSIKSLGNLKSVGGNLYLNNTPILKKYSKEEIKQMVNIEGDIYL
jgi:hypothetical protein